MKKILGIIGSPRKLGNSEIMVKEISRHISVPHELNLLRLQDFKILPCRGCYQCLFKTQGCVLNDDLNTVLKALVDADALIVSAPTYFLGLNASVKCFLDRGLSFYSHIEKLWGKPAVGVVTTGIQGKEGYSLLGIQSFLKLIFADEKNSRVVYGALPGEVLWMKRIRAQPKNWPRRCSVRLLKKKVRAVHNAAATRFDLWTTTPYAACCAAIREKCAWQTAGRPSKWAKAITSFFPARKRSSSTNDGSWA